MKILPVISSLFLAVSLSGCSSLFGDNDRTVTINAVPKGATVTVNNETVPSSPTTTIKVRDMWSPTVISIQKPGCQAQNITVHPEFQKVGFLNILVLPGFVVDAITGDMMRVPEDERKFDAQAC